MTEALTRRGLLRTAGVATGAAAFGTFTIAEADDDDTGLPTTRVETGPLPPRVEALPPIVSGLNYLTIAYHHFVPRLVAGLASGVSSTVGMNVSAPPAGTTFFAPLALPQGASIVQVAFECYNSSANTGLSVGITRTPTTSSFVGGSIAFTTNGATKHTVLVTPNPAMTVDNTTFAYGLSAFLQPPDTQFGLFGARVAWAPPAATGALFSPSTPQPRALDTRLASPLPGKFSSGDTKVLSLSDHIPAGAVAALVNLTITETEGAGFLGVFPAGTEWPGTSSINWSATGQNLANSVTVVTPADRSIAITAGGGGRTHVVVDVAGYFHP
jgi:hypothetical protein